MNECTMRDLRGRVLPTLMAGLCAGYALGALAAEPAAPEPVTVITAAAMIDGLAA